MPEASDGLSRKHTRYDGRRRRTVGRTLLFIGFESRISRRMRKDQGELIPKLQTGLSRKHLRLTAGRRQSEKYFIAAAPWVGRRCLSALKAASSVRDVKTKGS